jgi:hypothetical protein
MNGEVFVERLSAWAPGINGNAEWQEWAKGTRFIAASNESPALDFTTPVFQRRLSQLTRMTIQVLHDIMPLENVKTVFVSFRGEITAQYKINRMLIEDRELKPATFSLSVFNTAPAEASIALGLTSGYTAIYPGNFRDGFLAAAAPVLCGGAHGGRKIALVYADEYGPPEYGTLCPRAHLPLAFAALLSPNQEGQGGSLSIGEDAGLIASPERFLQYCLLSVRSCV